MRLSKLINWTLVVLYLSSTTTAQENQDNDNYGQNEQTQTVYLTQSQNFGVNGYGQLANISTHNSESYNNNTPLFQLQNDTKLLGNYYLESREANDNIKEKVDDEDGPAQKDIDEAVQVGLEMMHELHFVKEPELYRLGLFLDENEPAGRVAMFSAPNPRAQLQARYGYAAVQASIRLRKKYAESRSRQNPESISFLRTAAFSDQCPLRGIPRCSPASLRYRTADGTCNNLEQPWKGASMLPMQRFLLPSYDDGIQSVRKSVASGNWLPSPREISIRVHRDRDVEMSSVTMMFVQFGQFLDHDVTATAQTRAFNGSIPRCCSGGGAGFLPPEFLHPDCLPIPVPGDDFFLGRLGIRCLEFVRSAPSSRIDCDLGWREQITQVTSYIDASTVYGSDSQKADSLRVFRNGLLLYGRPRNSQNPPDPPGGEICRLGAISTQCFKGGDNRVGEQPGLTAFHTLWLRYHNRLAARLGNINSHWSDEKIYQETRRVVGAFIQHISYKEFLPIVLGHEVLDLFGLNLEKKGYYNGYDSRVNPAPANSFSTAAFRFGHSLVQNSYVRSDPLHRPLFNNVTIHEEQNNPENIWSFGSLDRLILGFSNQPSQRRDEFIGKELTNHLFQSPGRPFGMDLAAINIQRGRDHGIPAYTAWREPCGLSSVTSWLDLEELMSFETIQRFRILYEHVDDIDLYSGGLAERPVRGGVVGPTFACIIAQQFANLRRGDRFWYENGNFESSFTPAQLQQIRKVTFAHVLCSVLPEIQTIQPFVFLTPDNFRNARLPCNSPEIDNFDLRAWAERSFDFVDRNTISDKIDLSFDKESKENVSTSDKKKVNTKLGFTNRKPGIDNKLSFNVKPKVNTTKLQLNNHKVSDKLQLNTNKVSDKLDFGEQTTAKNSDVLNSDFDVLFFTSNKGIKKNKPEKSEIDDNQIFEILSKRSKRSSDDEDNDYDDNENLSRKRGNKKRKRKPNRRLSTTSRPTTKRHTIYFENKPLTADFYNPLKVKVTNVTTATVDISEEKYGNNDGYSSKPIYAIDKYMTNQNNHNQYYQTTRRPSTNYDDDDVFVMHPTMNKPNKGVTYIQNYVKTTQKPKVPDYQVNINIQYLVSTTPKTDIIIRKHGQNPNVQISQNGYQYTPKPNVQIVQNGYDNYYQTSKRPLAVIPLKTTTKRPYSSSNYNTPQPVQDIYEDYRPKPTPIYNERPAYEYSTKRPSYNQFMTRPPYEVVTKRPTYYERPTSSYNKYEDRPFSTSKRPYIYRPSLSYLAMFDDVTPRPTYITSYVEKVTKRPNIPSYLYLPETFYKEEDKDDEDVYKRLVESATQEPEDEYYGGQRDSLPDAQAHKKFVKISSVQGNRVLNKNKEQYIYAAQQREGDLDLFNEEVITIKKDEEIDRVLVDVIPRESRQNDWLVYNEIAEDGVEEVEEPIYVISNETNISGELPKPLRDFWEKHENKNVTSSNF